MTMIDLHYSNAMLPAVEREGILQDEKNSAEKILQLLKQLQECMILLGNAGVELPFGVLEDCVFAIRQHRNLKYSFTDEFRMSIVNTLLPLYINFPQKLALPKRTSILTILRIILRKTWTKLPCKLDWRPFWQELLFMIHREGRYDSTCAINVFIDHRDNLTAFLFNCRHYMDPLESSPDYPVSDYRESLISYAMNLLSNLRVVTSFEGVLALVFCLSNEFPEFVDYLPKWLETWSVIDNNQVWDFCWLLILFRATKHPVASKSFAWQSLVPFLLTKAKYILGISPYISSDSFPKGVPSYYMQLLVLWNDMESKVVVKFTKVLFHALSAEDKSLSLSTASITPPNLVREALKTCLENYPDVHFPALTEEVVEVKASCLSLCQFFQTIRLYLHPSNNQANAIYLARLTEVFLRCVVKKMASEVSDSLLNKSSETATAKSCMRGSMDRLTWNTYQYLQGYFFLVVVESMNSINFVMQGLNAISLNHLINLNPLFTHLITPFLLDALEPKSISQPQRILSALNAFNSNLRTMLYPNPCILQYLLTLLKLSIACLDPSDAQKSMDAMDLFIRIFYWIPLNPRAEKRTFREISKADDGGRAADTTVSLGSYCNLIPCNDPPTTADAASSLLAQQIPLMNSEDSQTQIETLFQYITTEWIFDYFDRIFLLIEGLEQGTNEHGLEISDLLYKIIYCNSILFQAMITTPSTAASSEEGSAISAFSTFLLTVEEKILQYVLREASLHVSKVCGKLVVALVANHPERFEWIFQKIVDEEILTHTASEEKMRYRLTLAGACCRMTLHQYTLPILQRYFNGAAAETSSFLTNGTETASMIETAGFLTYDRHYLYHKEVKVRRAYTKMIKDVLRGLCAIYPVDTKFAQSSTAAASFHQQQEEETLAAPVLPTDELIAWNIPSKESLSFVVAFIKYYTKMITEEIQTAIQTGVNHSSVEEVDGATGIGAGSGSGSGLENNKPSAKKCEEMLAINLSLLAKMIRGCAEVLGDLLPSSASSSPQPIWIMSTGQEALLQQLPYEDQIYLCSYRHQMMSFLHEMMTQIARIPDSSPYIILHNHPVIADLWMRTFHLLLSRRISFMKNPEAGLTNHNFTKLSDDSVFTRAIYEALKQAHRHHHHYQRGSDVSEGLVALRDLNYWKFHDRTLNWIALKIWFQHSVRVHTMSYNMIQALYTPPVFTSSSTTSSSASPFSLCLEDVLRFGSHEYDTISVKGTKFYAQITFFCSLDLVRAIFTSLFQRLYDQSRPLTFYDLVAVLEICKVVGLLPRWCLCVELKLLFFQALPKLWIAIAQIEDQEKKQLAILSLTDLFALYGISWSHTREELCRLQQALIPLILQETSFGRIAMNDLSITSSSLIVDVREASAKKDLIEGVMTEESSVEIEHITDRSDILYGFLLLHLIDRSLLETISTEAWQAIWYAAVRVFSGDHLLPVQPLMEAILIRLVEIVYQFHQEDPHSFAKHEKFLAVKRLFFSTDIDANNNNLPSPITTATSPVSNETTATTATTTSTTITSIPTTTTTMAVVLSSLNWSSLLQSYIQYRAVISSEEEESDDNGGGGGGSGVIGNCSGWSSELASMAHAMDYLKIVKKRFFTSKMFEFNLSSDYFQKEISAAVYSFASSGYWDWTSSASAALVSDLFQALLHISTSNETEKRAVNTLQAEIFAGLYRAFLAFLQSRRLFAKQQQQKTEETEEKENEEAKTEEVLTELEHLFSHFLLVDILESISLEYGREWQEAISFALEDYYCEHLGRTHQMIIEIFRKALKETPLTSTAFTAAAAGITMMAVDAQGNEEEGGEERDDSFGDDNDDQMEEDEHPEDLKDMDVDDHEDGEEEGNEEEEEEEEITSISAGIGGMSTKTTTAVLLDEGFANRSKIFMFTFGLLNGDCIARVTSPVRPENPLTNELLVANELLQILIHPETNVLSPYHTSRYEFASIINTLIDFFSYQAYYYHHYDAQSTTAGIGDKEGGGYFEFLPLLYAKITSGVTTAPPPPPNPATTTPFAEASMTEQDRSVPPFDQLEDDPRSPPRKKKAILQTFDAQHYLSRSGTGDETVPLSYSADSSVLLGLPLAPSHTFSQSISIDDAIVHDGSRNLILRGKSLEMGKSLDSVDNDVMKPSFSSPEVMKGALMASNSFMAPSESAVVSEQQKQLLLKQTIDTITHILGDILRWIPIQWISLALQQFFPVLMQGLIHSEVEVIGKSSEALQVIISSLFPPSFLPSGTTMTLYNGIGTGVEGFGSDFHQSWLDQLYSLYQQYSFSWKIKAMILQLAMNFMNQHWFYLTMFQRQSLKTLFMNGIRDDQLNIRGVASSGMISYLAFKTSQELKEIAELYTRNSEKLATREKNRRKKQRSYSRDFQDSMNMMNTFLEPGSLPQSTGMSTASSLPDSEYMLNIQMMSCIILTRSYDLPGYLPNLIASFLRHRHYYDINKLIITKTIQMFRESHHDRWEEYQLQFTNEQLMELQGVGAAYYFA